MRSREARGLLLIAAVFGVAFLADPRMSSSESVNAILLNVPLLIVMAVGQMLVIVSRGIDVSVGSTLGAAGIAAGVVFRDAPGAGTAVGIAVALGLGILLGLVNGLVIAKAKVPPIVVTLGALSVYRGLAFLLSRGEQIDSNQLPEGLLRLATQGPLRIGGTTIPWIVVIAVVVAVAGHVFARCTVAGRSLYAIGDNLESARLHGLAVDRLTILAYCISGGLAGLAGILYASKNGFVNPGTAGLGLELNVIAASVIGGIDVRGGKGSVPGVVIGSVLLALIGVALAITGIAADWQLLVYGAVILAALLLDQLFDRRRVAAT